MNQPKQPRLASTVVMYRHLSNSQVYMLRRSAKSTFMPNALVFPGGKIEESDSESVWDWLSDLSPAQSAQSLYLDADYKQARALYIAGIRETFEESGVLLAENKQGESIDPKRLDSYRKALNSGALQFEQVVTQLDLRLTLAALTFFSRWVTPKVESRRFDAFFFLADVTAMAPKATADGAETEEGRWEQPSEILEQHHLGRVSLAPPTLRILETLAGTQSNKWNNLRRSNNIGVCPQLVAGEPTPTLALPNDPLFTPSGSTMNRFVYQDGRWHSFGEGF